MKKLILTIVLCAFAMVVAGLNVRSMQNRGVKEATVEAEVEDIVGMIDDSHHIGFAVANG